MRTYHFELSLLPLVVLLHVGRTLFFYGWSLHACGMVLLLEKEVRIWN